MRKKTILPILIVLIGCMAIVGYNDLFLRRKPMDNPLLEQINPIPYVTYFDLKQNKPHAVFQTPIFPGYNTYCHTAGKPCQFIPFQQLYADMLRIGSIQYIGVNLGKDSEQSLYTLFDTLTTLAPFWAYPYSFAELVVPMQKNLDVGSGSAEKMAQKSRSRSDAIAIGKKGEFFLCDAQKLKEITGLSQQEFIDAIYNSGDKSLYRNPCNEYQLPHYLAFNYFYFLTDTLHSAEQYRISAFHDDAPALTPLMAALVYGRGGEHLKSATLRYDRYLSLSEDTAHDENMMADAKRALLKAIFEIQLQLISEAADKTPGCGTRYQCLQEKGAIRESIRQSRTETCHSGKETQNLRCVLINAGLHMKLITLDGKLIYPLDPSFSFTWSSEFKSRWAQPIQR